MLLMFLPWAQPANAVAADGTPDTAFTDAVTSTGDSTGFNNTLWWVAEQADGKIVVGGDFTTLNGDTANRIARLNADGTPDTDFIENTETGFNARVWSVALQPDGKIVVAGNFTKLNGAPAYRLARLNADGTPDTDFNEAVNSTGDLKGFDKFVSAVAVQTDGKIVVGGGFDALNGATANRIARLNADGTPDTAFITKTGSGFGGDNPKNVWALALQTNGKIVVGGSFSTLDGATVDGIARLNADGSPDTAFTQAVSSTGDESGFYRPEVSGFPEGSGWTYALAVQTDDKIVVGGEFTALNGVAVTSIARLDADGTPDMAFTESVKSTGNGTAFRDESRLFVHAVEVQGDGKIVVGGGFTTLNGERANRIARLDADGTPDAAFIENTGAGFSASTWAVATQADGKILVGGSFTTLNGKSANRIAQLNSGSGSGSGYTSSSGQPTYTFSFLTSGGGTCLADVTVTRFERVTLPPASVACTPLGTSLAGWSIPGQDWAFNPGRVVTAVDSQVFTAVAREPVLTVTYDANVGMGDECVASGANAKDEPDRLQTMTIPRAGDAATLATSAPCAPPGFTLIGWTDANTPDGSGQAQPTAPIHAPGSAVPETWNLEGPNPVNTPHVYALWEQSET